MTNINKEKVQIWVVDDNKEFLKDLKFALSLEGWQVKAFEDPIKFLEDLNYETPGCIILDVRMPKLTGDEVQELLEAKNCPLPVIFLTGHGDLNLAIHTFRNGAFDFIQKPFDPDYLLSTVEKAVRLCSQEFSKWQGATPKELFDKLTHRQKQVLIDISKNVPSRFIADHLNISIRTVERHRQNAMRICKLKNSEELIKFLKQVKS